MNKKLITNLEDELIKARKEGLEEIRKRISMQGHGKTLGMDTFSWAAPNFENLATVVQNFPFPVVWLARHEQLRCALTYYPEIQNQLDHVIIYDQGNIQFKKELYDNVGNVAAVGSIDHAIQLLQAISNEKKILLFTTDDSDNCSDLEFFWEFAS